MKAGIALLLVGLMGLVGGCSGESSGSSSGPGADGYQVTVTVGMVGDIVQNVAGDRAQVRGLIGHGIDPHTYKPTTADVKALQAADIIFYNGLLLEGKMTDTLVKLARTGKPIYAVTELIDEAYLLHPTGAEGHPDPHLWMDVQGWIQATEAVAAALAEYDPDHAAAYRQNADAYIASLRELDAYARRSIASIPTPNGDKPVLITAHDAFGYFGRAYGVEVLGIQGISTESEAGLQDIQQLLDVIVQRDVKAVFVETSVSDGYVQSLVDGARARGRTIRIGGSLYSDAMGSGGTYEGTYIGMIDHNVTTITRALGGDAPEKGMQGRLGQ